MATILHKIKAYLYDNVLTKDNPNDLSVRIVTERSLNVQQICLLGFYNLEVVAPFTDRSLLKQTRTASLDKLLTVE
jgi:hypothetical protein